MFPVQPLRSSAESYAGARLLVRLHEAGVGLREAALALEPIAENMWRLFREAQEVDEDLPRATLNCDPSVGVICDDVGMDGELECMTIGIARQDRFCILLWCHAPEGGEFIPFADGDPMISLEAEDVTELATFLTLTRALGGELTLEDEG
jgi:hypothetical protein